MVYKVFIYERPYDHFNNDLIKTLMGTFCNEVEASLKARQLYLNGVYNVKVINNKGKESLLWTKPIKE